MKKTTECYGVCDGCGMLWKVTKEFIVTSITCPDCGTAVRCYVAEELLVEEA